VDAVETNQPFLGSQPKITVSHLDDRCHIVFRQSLLLLPDFVNELRQGFSWVEGLGRGAPEGREGERKETCPSQDREESKQFDGRPIRLCPSWHRGRDLIRLSPHRLQPRLYSALSISTA
jgi:hypothetical protein